jgi:PAS domain S-box-containing protein
MKIKTKLQLIIIVNILILAGVVCLSLLWQKQTEDLIEQNAIISELQAVIFERARLREEYFLNRTARAKAQFLLIHREIGGRLERMSKAFHDPEEKASLDEMIGAHLKIGHLFDRLIRLDEGTGDRPAGTQALRERIISQMLIHAHVMYRDGAKLLKAANEKTAKQNDRDRWYGYITIGLLALLIGAFAVIIIRNIAYPLTRLHEGTEMVARGDLSYKTDLGTRDEIGRLSRAFDAMTESLKEITVSRDELNREIEVRKRKEEELRAISSYQESLLSSLPDIIMEVDGNKVYTWANQPGRDFFGEEVVGKEASFYFEGDQDTYATVQPLFNGNENVVHLESWQRRRDGEKRLLSWRCRVLKDENGQVIGALSSARDITARKTMQEELRASEEKYRLLAENSADIVWILDFKKQKFTYFNPSVESIRGYTPEEAMELPLDKTLTSDSYKRAMDILKEALAGAPRGLNDPKRIPAFEFQEFCKDGSLIDTETRMRFILNERGKPVGVQGITRDVTERKRAEQSLLKTTERLRRSLAGTVQAISAAVEVKDPYTSGHQKRTADLARAIAVEMGFSADRTEFVRIATTIHDIGKIAVPAEILSKPTKLREIEFGLIRVHPQAGYDILKDIEFPWPVADVILQHHERMDGSGYPQGLKGEDILLEARIVSVADVMEAIASHRPYRAALGIDVALAEISQHRGILYDPEVTDACLKLFYEKGYCFN